MPEAAIGLMARYPRLGTAKTRLAKAVGDTQALDVYHRLLRYTCRLVTELERPHIHRDVFVTPASDTGLFEDEYPGFDGYRAQSEGDLGQRMRYALTRLLALPGVNKAMLIGADCPVLTSEHINLATKLLRDHDLVLGPSSDGGYYLIGVTRVAPELFSEIKWGESSVTKSTLARASAIGLSTGLLPELRDLDDQADLDYFLRLNQI